MFKYVVYALAACIAVFGFADLVAGSHVAGVFALGQAAALLYLAS